ncbi:glycosyltransferase family 2 protein [Clostridium sp. YIM B02505]|uniref:Glycosyltransferase family 2 protein n=1 Tax=Clostridium yunnanense TaxID=2800325 RepID=A0ABS1EX31_9CLOT|nr:glycosyltransferase family 2 protein [Clostridium yunnanense]MBK1813896.1 glycosyltransferase family 2 protein [Clostridium yunnanense]
MFSVIIANWNGEALIEKCLQSFVNQSFKEFKLYIVDNGSKDSSIDIINGYCEVLNIEIIKLDSNTGFAYANNVGMLRAFEDDNSYIITLNNDLEVEENCFKVLKRFIESNVGYDIFQITMINYYNRSLTDATGLSFNKRNFVSQMGYGMSINEISNMAIDIDGACAGAAVYSKAALKKVQDENGVFDSRFFAYFEDTDLALRLKNAGFKAALVKSAVVYHMHSATGKKESPFKEYYLTRNFFLYQKKNSSSIRYYMNMPFYIKAMIDRTAQLLKAKEFECAKARVKGILDYLRDEPNKNILENISCKEISKSHDKIYDAQI